jgi:hypothetical protein
MASGAVRRAGHARGEGAEKGAGGDVETVLPNRRGDIRQTIHRQYTEYKETSARRKVEKEGGLFRCQYQPQVSCAKGLVEDLPANMRLPGAGCMNSCTLQIGGLQVEWWSGGVRKRD